MQVSTLNAQMGLGSLIVHWCRDATSVPYVRWLIDFSSRTDKRLRCTNTGSIPSKLLILENLRHLKSLYDYHTNFLPSPSVLIVFRKLQSHSFNNCPEEIFRFLYESVGNRLKVNLRSLKRHHKAKFQSKVQHLALRRNTWKGRREFLASGKSLQLIKVITHPVNNHLCCLGAVCSRFCYYVQQEFEHPVS